MKINLTPRQPQLKPKITIKVPKNLNDRNEQCLYQSLKDYQVQSKKQFLLYNATSRQRQLPRYKTAQISLESELKYKSLKLSSNSDRKPVSAFKIKMSGAGFKRRSESSGKTHYPPKNLHTLEPNAKSGTFILSRQRRLVSFSAEKTQKIKVKPHKIKTESIHFLQSHQKKEEKKPNKRSKDLKQCSAKIIQTKQAQKQASLEGEASEISWDEEPGYFSQYGFGVSQDLSNYDLVSLDDPHGVRFLQKYISTDSLQLDRRVKCPQFLDKKYKWVEVVVKGFNSSKNKAIVKKAQISQNKQQLVSRMSILVDEDQIIYWLRINNAKKLRKYIRQQLKYIRYLDSRPQNFPIPYLLKELVPKNYLQVVEKQFYTRYARHFIVQHEMHQNTKKFHQLGFKKRGFSPFVQHQRYKPFRGWSRTLQKVSQVHYSIIQNLPKSLFSINERLRVQNLNVFQFPTRPMRLQELVRFQLQCVDKAIKNMLKIRELIISESICFLKSSFKDRQQEIKYFKLHNFIYKESVMSNFYQQNIKQLINYLHSFATLDRNSKPSVMEIELRVDILAKKVEEVPSEREVFAGLNRMIIYLEQQIPKIPDLMDELVFQECSFLKVTSKINPAVILNAALKSSYSKIKSYIETFKGHLKYLEKVHFNKLAYNDQSIEDYDKVLTQIEDDLKLLMHSSLENSGIFRVSLTPFKQILSQAILKYRNRILRQIQKQIIQENRLLLLKFSEIYKRLEHRPLNEQQFVDMRKYVNRDCEQFYVQAKHHQQLSSDFYRLLQDHFYVYGQQFEQFLNIIVQHCKLLEAMGSKRSQLLDVQKQLIEKINEERQVILKGIDDSQARFQKVVNFGIYGNYRPNYIQVSQIYFDLSEYLENLDWINKREALLKQQLSLFPRLPKLIKNIQPFHDLWSNVFNFKNDKSEWTDKPIAGINSQDVIHKMNEVFNKEFTRLGKFFLNKKNSSAVMICEYGSKQVQSFKDNIWIIESFTKQGLIKKPNMFKDILIKLIPDEQSIDPKSISLNDLLKTDILQHKDFVLETANKAERVWKLEKKVNNVVSNIKELFFDFHTEEGRYHLENSQLHILQSVVNQERQLMEVMKSEQEASLIDKKMNSVYYKVILIQQSLEAIQKFQGPFLRAKKIFKITQISVELPTQKTQLLDIDKMWTNLTAHFMRDLQIWECLDSESYRNRILSASKKLQQINTHLGKLLNKKRTVFPRLFFVKDDDLLDMAIAQKVQLVSEVMIVLFYGVRDFLHDEKHIIGARGYDNEQFIFSKSISCQIVIWDRLKLIHQSIKEVVKSQLCVDIKAELRLFTHHYNQELCDWTIQTETSIAKGGKNQLKSYFERYCKIIENRLLAGIGDYYIMSRQLILRDTIDRLVKNNVQELTNMSWQECVRYYRVQKSIIMQTFFIKSMFHYEYTGYFQQTAFIDTMRHNIHILIVARSLNTAGFVSSQNKETIKEICLSLLHHYVQVQCPQGQDYLLASNIMKGTFSDGLWCSLLNVQKMSTQIASQFANALYEVQSIIRQKRFYTDYFQIQMQIPKDYRISLYFIKNSKENQKVFCFHSNSLLRASCRSLTLTRPSWVQIVRWKLYGHKTEQKVQQQIIQTLQLFQVKNESKWYHNYFFRIIQNMQKQVNIMDWSSQTQLYEHFLQALLQQLTSQQIELLGGRYKGNIPNVDQKDDQTIIKKTIKLCILKGQQLLIVGPPLSGKSSIIIQQFKELNTELPFRVPKYDPQLPKDKWQLVGNISAHCFIPIHSKVIIQAIDVSNADPSFVQQMHVLYIRQNPDPIRVYQQQAIIRTGKSIQELPCTYQLNLSNLKKMLKNYCGGWPDYIKIRLALSLFYALDSWVNEGTIPQEETTAKELLFIMTVWVFATFNNEKVLKGSEFSASLPDRQNPKHYFYSVEKSAWLQWGTFNDNITFSTAPLTFGQIYLPLKETTSTLYFASIMAKTHNVVICSTNSGVGKTALIKKIMSQKNQNEHIVQGFILTTNSSFKKIQNMLTVQAASHQKNGYYCPAHKKTLNILVEDMHLATNYGFVQEFRILLENQLLTTFRKKIGNFKVVASAKFTTQKFNNLAFRLIRFFVPLAMESPNQESMKSLFTFILDWFFGNTESPFSKEVRQMSDIIVSASTIILEKLKQQPIFDELLTLRKMCKVFQGVTLGSPKSTKTAKDIIHLWSHEMRRTFSDGELIANFDPILLSSLAESMAKNERQVGNQYSTKQIIYCKTETYQQTSLQTIHSRLTKIAKDTLPQSHIALYRDLIIKTCHAMRVFLQCGGHLLKLGKPGTGKKTASTLASLAVFGKMPVVVSNVLENYQKQISDFFTSQHASPNVLIFEVENRDDHKFLEIISEILETGELRSFLFEKNHKFLERLELSSFNSPKYLTFVKKCQQNFHFVVNLPGKDQEFLRSYPALVKCVSSIDYNCQFSRESLKEIALVTVGQFFIRAQQLCANFHESFREASQLQKCNFKKVISDDDYLKWMKLSKQIYHRAKFNLQKEDQKVKGAIAKVQKTEQQKIQFQVQLKLLIPKLVKMTKINSNLNNDLQRMKAICSEKVILYQKDQHAYFQQKKDVDKLQQQCERELAKVMPMLAEAEQALEKVTRDDINQLRSFPNPPAPAARVCESLIYLFNEDTQVKEKILQNGQKIRDFWEYAKKFILTDKLLKRVSDFKPETIKTLPKNKVLQLKQIIKNKDFDQERVFKASSAAGNLSLWLRAVIATFDVMEVIDPKKKILNEALQALQTSKLNLQQHRGRVDSALAELNQKQSIYKQAIDKQNQLSDAIQSLQARLERSTKYLLILKQQEKVWQKYIGEKLKSQAQEIRVDSILAALWFTYIAGCPSVQKDKAKQLQEGIFTRERAQGNFNILGNQCLKDERELLLSREVICPVVEDNLESFRCLLFKVKEQNSQLLYVIDETRTLIKSLGTVLDLEIIDCLIYQSFQALQQSVFLWAKMNNQVEEPGSDNDDSALKDFHKQEAKRPTIRVLINLEYNQKIINEAKKLEIILKSISACRHLILFQQKTELLQGNCQIDIFNSLSFKVIKQQIRQKTSPSINNQTIEWSHYKEIIDAKQQLITILCGVDNILIEDNLVNRWLEFYDRLRDLTNTKLKLKKVSPIEDQVLDKASQFDTWKYFHNFEQYMTGIGNFVEQKGHEAIWSLNEYQNEAYPPKQNLFPITLIHKDSQSKSSFVLWTILKCNEENFSLIRDLSNARYIMDNKLKAVIVIQHVTMLHIILKELFRIYREYVRVQQLKDDVVLTKQEINSFSITILAQGKHLSKYDQVNLIHYQDILYTQQYQSLHHSIACQKEVKKSVTQQSKLLQIEQSENMLNQQDYDEAYHSFVFKQLFKQKPLKDVKYITDHTFNITSRLNDIVDFNNHEDIIWRKMENDRLQLQKSGRGIVGIRKIKADSISTNHCIHIGSSTLEYEIANKTELEIPEINELIEKIPGLILKERK